MTSPLGSTLRRVLAASFILAGGNAWAQSPEVVSGTLMLLNGDIDPARGGGRISIVRLHTDAGATFRLDLSGTQMPDGGLHRLAGKRIDVEVSMGTVADAAPGSIPVLQPRALRASPSVKNFSKVTGNQPWISILCRFAGNLIEPRDPAYFTTQLSNTFPGFNHYFREASYNQVTLDGSTAHSMWVSLPQPRTFYIDGVKTSAVYLTELATHCTAAADAAVNFAPFAGVNLMFNGELDDAAWGGQQNLTLDGVPRVLPTTWMPYHGEASTFGWRQHGILAHEMAHGFASPHSASPDGNEYGSSWDVVSNPGAHCELPGVNDPNYGCIGQSMNAQAKIIMEMIPVARMGNYPGTGTQGFLVERLAQPPLVAGTVQAVKVALPGTTTRFLSVESRQRIGYDLKLPGDGVIIHLVDTALDPPARLVAPVGAVNPGALGAIWPVGSTYTHASGVAVTVQSRDGVTGTATISVTFAAPVVAKRSDLNGDGRSDVVWRDGTTGSNYAWLMDGLAVTSQGFLPSVPASWTLAGTGDVNADGRADLFWREQATGLNYQWQMNGLAITAQGYLPSVPAPWVVTGLGDVDADNRADVFWRNPATGDNYLWILNGLVVTSQGYLPNVGGTNWEMAGIADYSGDNRADVLWRNKATGENYLWVMNGLTVQSQGFLPAVAGPDWEVVGSPNADGDARADVLWRNKVTGDNYLWLMNGLTLIGQGYLPAVTDAAWKVVGFGDYNNDGRGDVLWRHATTGQDYLWTLNGLLVTSQGYLPTVADVNWLPVR